MAATRDRSTTHVHLSPRLKRTTPRGRKICCAERTRNNRAQPRIDWRFRTRLLKDEMCDSYHSRRVPPQLVYFTTLPPRRLRRQQGGGGFLLPERPMAAIARGTGDGQGSFRPPAGRS